MKILKLLRHNWAKGKRPIDTSMTRISPKVFSETKYKFVMKTFVFIKCRLTTFYNENCSHEVTEMMKVQEENKWTCSVPIQVFFVHHTNNTSGCFVSLIPCMFGTQSIHLVHHKEVYYCSGETKEMIVEVQLHCSDLFIITKTFYYNKNCVQRSPAIIPLDCNKCLLLRKRKLMSCRLPCC